MNGGSTKKSTYTHYFILVKGDTQCLKFYNTICDTISNYNFKVLTKFHI